MNKATNSQVKVVLDKFKPRPYQIPIIKAFERDRYKRMILVMPRRSGKDLTCWNLIIREALRKVGIYFYIFPTYAQGKKVIFDSITNDGIRFLDYIPREVIRSVNANELKITLVNSSIIQIVGSNNYDSLMGTNPRGCVFSEFALSYLQEKAYRYIRPILTANKGFVIILSTPRGRNWFWDLYNIAINNDDWFVHRLTVDDTHHIPIADIKKEIDSGEISQDLANQEYWCEFAGGEGIYYAKYMDRMQVEGRIGPIHWDPSHEVHTAWDLGVRDHNCIIWFQCIDMRIHIIDCYSKSGEGLEHYAKIIRDKPYTYGSHFAPHDIKVREWGSGLTRYEKAQNLGIYFEVVPNIPISDGIELVRSTLNKVCIDSDNCQPLIKALENYRCEEGTRSGKPLHDQFSHFADAMRYLAISIPKTKRGLTPEDIEKAYQESRNESHTFGHPIFSDDVIEKYKI